MWTVVNDIYTLISKKDKFRFKILIILIFLMSLFEIIGLALILPFLFLVNNLDITQTNSYINTIYTYFNFQDPLSFLYFIGTIAIIFSFLGMILSVLTNLKLTKFSNDIGIDFSIRLLDIYIHNNDSKNPTEEYKNNRKNLLTETAIISSSIVLPSLVIISKIILISILFIALLMVDYSTTFSFFGLLLCIYTFIFYLSSKKVKVNIKTIDLLKQEKNLLIYSALQKKGYSEKEYPKIIKEYASTAYRLSKYQIFNNVVSKLPRYLIMFLVFSFVVMISLYMIEVNNGNMGNIMTKMVFYIIIGLKILPQVQNVFMNYLKLKSNISSFTNIKYDLFQATK